MIKVMLLASVFAMVRIWMVFNVKPDVFSWASAYKDAAHLFIAVIGSFAWINQPGSLSSFLFWKIKKLDWRWKLFWALNVLEILSAIASRV